MLKQRMIHPRHIKQSQLFITTHATAKNTKHKAKTISSMAWQSIGRSKKELFLPHNMNFSTLFQTKPNYLQTKVWKRGSNQLIQKTKKTKQTKNQNENEKEDAPRKTQLCMKQ